MKKIKGFKGFKKDMSCNGFRFKVGETFEEKNVELCKSGFHFCEHPLNVFDYYAPSESIFAEVEGDGEIQKAKDDTKVVCSRLKIVSEISIGGLVEAAVNFVFDNAKWSKNEKEKATGDQGAASATGYQGAASATGDQGAASATGDQGAASATGYQGAASATGYQGAASATGYQGAACSLGIKGKAKAEKGGWIILSEWEEKDYVWNRIDVKAIQVDGETIKANTFYMLKKGQFVECL